MIQLAMDPLSEHPVGNFSTEKAVFKDLAGLLRLGVDELNRQTKEAFERMPEVKASYREMVAGIDWPDTHPLVVRKINSAIARGIVESGMLIGTGALESIRLSTGVIIKAREILGPKKK